MTVVNPGDQRPQPEPAGRLRQRGQRHPPFQARARRIGEDRIEVVERPARLEDLDIVGFLPHGQHVRPGGVLRSGLKGESHEPILPNRHGRRCTAAARLAGRSRRHPARASHPIPPLMMTRTE